MKVGFIGAGNMGGAILEGVIENGALKGEDVYLVEANVEKAETLSSKYGINICNDLVQLIAASDVIIAGVKPNVFEGIMPTIAENFTNDKIFVSMAAGITIGYLEGYLGNDKKIIRIMPNTPAMVGEAMVAVCRNANVQDELFEPVFELFKAIGKAEEIPEALIHCVIGVSGSSPAYTYMYIDALAEAAVKNGMDKEKALMFAAQSVLGAAKMVLETGIDPVQLRINVCSPGGTTIEAVNVLLKNGFGEKLEEGFQAAVDKSIKMS